MLTTCTDPLFGLSSDLTSAIIAQWLDLKDLAFADSAYCNSVKRGLFLKAHGSLPITLPKDFDEKMFSVVIQWINLRGIHVSSLNSFKSFGPVYSQYTNKFGSHVKEIKLKRINFGESDILSTTLCQMVQECSELSTMVLDYCITHPASLDTILKSIEQCSSLRELIIDNCYNYDIAERSDSVVVKNGELQLSTLVVNADHHIVLPALQMVSPIHLKKLATGICNKEVADHLLAMFDQCTNLSTLQLGDMSNELLIALLHKCPTIEHLQARCIDMSDVSVPAICSLPLRSLDVCYTYFTNQLLFQLAEHCNHSLESLILTGCRSMTDAGLNEVLTQCSKLHTLHMFICSEDDVHVHLMGELTMLHLHCDDGMNPVTFLHALSVHNNKLQHLSISVSEFRNNSYTSLKTAAFPHLRTLSVRSESSRDSKKKTQTAEKLRSQLPSVQVVVNVE